MRYAVFFFRGDRRVVKTNNPKITLHAEEFFGNFHVYVVYNSKPIAVITFQGNISRSRRFKLFESHAFVAKAWRGKGLTKMVYTWFLNAGHIIITKSHTKGAAHVWDSLANRFRERWFDESKDTFVDHPKDTKNLYRVLMK